MEITITWLPKMGCWSLHHELSDEPYALVMPKDIEPGGRWHSRRELFLLAQRLPLRDRTTTTKETVYRAGGRSFTAEDIYECGKQHGSGGVHYYPPDRWGTGPTTREARAAYERGYGDGRSEWRTMMEPCRTSTPAMPS